MTSEIRALAELILKSVDAIDASCAARDADFPPLDEPFTPESEAARMHPDVLPHVGIIASAAQQLICTVRVPATNIVNASTQGYFPACLRVACELNVPEILRDAGSDGLHVDAIASASGVDSKKLSRILRYLATHHYFKEISPEVYANNRLSSMLDKGQPLERLRESPESKYEKPQSALAALSCHLTDEGFKGAAWFYENLVDSNTKESGEPTKAPLTRAYRLGESETYWSFLESPGQKDRLTRFGAAMDGVNSLQPPETILRGYDWDKLPTGSVVVDVGGGIGAVSLEIAKAAPKVNIVVQDRPAVIEDAVKFWTRNYDAAIKEQRVSFQPHDFFEEQPIKNPAVFLLRQITHDWSDPYVTKILRAVRQAAGPNTHLVVLDTIIPYACRDPGVNAVIPGATRPVAPSPLLGNMGTADPVGYQADMNMMSLLNGCERTLGHMVELFEKSGWKIIRVHYNDPAGLYLPHIIAEPI